MRGARSPKNRRCAVANSPGNTPHSAPILIVHLDPGTRRMMQEIFALEGYVAQEAGRVAEALRILQAAEDGMIVYLEPLFLHIRGNERLHDYVMERGPHNLHVFILLAAIPNIQAAMAPLRADGYLAQPFTVPQMLASAEDAHRLLQAKRA
jgi:DNA-binding NtrC family response regulator